VDESEAVAVVPGSWHIDGVIRPAAVLRQTDQRLIGVLRARIEVEVAAKDEMGAGLQGLRICPDRRRGGRALCRVPRCIARLEVHRVNVHVVEAGGVLNRTQPPSVRVPRRGRQVRMVVGSAIRERENGRLVVQRVVGIRAVRKPGHLVHAVTELRVEDADQELGLAARFNLLNDDDVRFNRGHHRLERVEPRLSDRAPELKQVVRADADLRGGIHHRQRPTDANHADEHPHASPTESEWLMIQDFTLTPWNGPAVFSSTTVADQTHAGAALLLPLRQNACRASCAGRPPRCPNRAAPFPQQPPADP